MRVIIVRCCILAFLLTLAVGPSTPAVAQIAVGITVGFAPPDLPVYEQPICPGDGYLWTPGFWAWDDDIGDYYWVPGTWVLAPEPGFFWTPGYWAWGGSGFIFNEGYWGPIVGFYGGVYYGYGYFGHGFEGGRWENDHFFYNQAVTNVNVTVVHNVYKTTINETNITRVSYNGGNGGITARPTVEEERAAHEQHVAPVPAQRQHIQAARSDPRLRASANHGKPPIAATQRPGALSGGGVVQAREAGAVHGGPRNTGGGGGGNAPRPNAMHPNELSPHEHPTPVNSGNSKADQKYQQAQEKLYARQEKDHQRLQQQQEKEHQQLAKRNGNDAARQQMEQRHQQQTQQMEQRHTQERQQQESRAPQPQQHPPKGH